MLGTLWILTANATWYPWSSLGSPYASFAANNWHGFTPLFAASLVLGGAIIMTLVRCAGAQGSVLLLRPRSRKALAISGVSASLLALLSISSQVEGDQAASSAKPHVILIGVDSLRTDVALGSNAATITPAIHDFLRDSTVFSNTLTPLARTFPAWVSILSGRNPHITGAVINLFPRELIKEGDTLPAILRRNGYETMYAIDEVRFSNLDQTYGFDKMIAPPMGATDFILGFFADTPLSNLLVNTHLGRYLFPYAHGNRAASITYEPDTFVEELASELTFERPTFLAVHMTLAHWPYTWASAKPHTDSSGQPEATFMYEQALHRVDEQFRDVLNALRKKGALKNAIVVVLSDHGESLGEPASARVPDSHEAGKAWDAAEVFGHGTDIFAAQQYQVVLGFRTFGTTPLTLSAGRSIDAPASLEDIAPTIVDALDMDGETPFDGASLLPLLTSAGEIDASHWNQRVRFTETEFNPPGVALGQAITTSALSNAALFYRIDPTTDRIHFREGSLGEILTNRQYAASRAGRMLASVPAPGAIGHFVAFVEHPGAQPRWIAADSIAAEKPEVAELWAALNHRFPSTEAAIGRSGCTVGSGRSGTQFPTSLHAVVRTEALAARQYGWVDGERNP